jgi:UDP-GlcNAc:undecaprenyl-phosphate GlcNAc-1-phosphate transferase
VPIVGGVAMFIGMLVGLVVARDAFLATPYLPVAAALLVLFGLLDDRYGLPPSARLAAQVTVVLIMVYGGELLIRDVGNPFGLGVIGLGPLMVIGTIIITLTVINGFNLIDGLDGLAGSLGLVALLAVMIVGGWSETSTLIAAIMGASIIGFLLFNFPMVANRRVRVFMGDSGSTLIGLVVVWVTISVSQGEGRIASPVICLWFASIPVYDILTCTVRRLLKRRSPLRPDSKHFHHVLKRGGLRVRQVLIALTGLQIIYASLALLAHFAGIPDVVMFVSWSILGLSQFRVLQRFAAMHRLKQRRMRGRLPPAEGSLQQGRF